MRHVRTAARPCLVRAVARVAPAVLALLVLLAAQFSPAQATSPPDIVVVWGDNTRGQTNIPAGLTDGSIAVTAISAGWYHSLALKRDGTVMAWGYNFFGQTNVPAGLTDGSTVVTALSAGNSHSLALKSNGAIVAWGGGPGYVPTALADGTTPAIAIAAGDSHNLALMSDRTVVAWGNNFAGQSSVPSGLTGVTAIAAGFDYNLALKSDDTIAAWGLNNYGQTDVPAQLSGVTAIAAGGYHALALKSDGTVVAWGKNDYGQTNVPAGLTDGSTRVTAIAAGLYHSLALKSDGTVVAWGNNLYGQTNVPTDLRNVTALSAGGFHNLTIGQRVDLTAPSASATLAETPGNNGWYTSDVVVTWNWNDNAGGDGIDTTRCPGGTTSSGEGAVEVNGECYDLAGNRGINAITIKIDKTAPVVTITSRPANLSTSSSAIFDFAAMDTGGSGLASLTCSLDNAPAAACTSPANYTSLADGIHTFSVTAADNAGNSATPATYTWFIDTTPPRVAFVTSTAADGVYTTGAVFDIRVSFNEAVLVNGTPQLTLETGATDAVANYTSGSGTSLLTFRYTVAAGQNSADLDYTSSTALGLNGGAIKDAAFNSATLTLPAPGTAGSLGANKNLVIDTTPPVITPNVVETPGSNGWYTGDVNVSWSVTDPESTVTGQSGCDAQSVTSDTAGVTFTCSATSGGGGNSQDVTVKRDATPPVLAPIVSPNPAVLNSTATASVNATDATSLVASQSCGTPDTSSAGVKSVSCTASDNAGNTATVPATYTVVNNPPTIAVAPGGACRSDSIASGTINLVVADANTGPNGLTLTVASNNPTVVPNAGVTFGGSGANRTMTVTAATKKTGTAAVLTIGVSDGTSTSTFSVNVRVGTDKNETLNGTADTDMIFGLAGANTINGLGAIDLLCGGNAVDTISGGDGADTMGGGRGDDRLTGGTSGDLFGGGPGIDTATDFKPSEGDTQDGTVERVTLVAAADAVEIAAPVITDWVFLPAVQN